MDNFNTRILDGDESGCVERCASKYIRYNHRVMGDFVKTQSVIMARRVQDQNVEESREIATKS